jgi:hypothetical protein
MLTGGMETLPGIAIAVKLHANPRWCLGMLLAVTAEELHYFEHDGHGISHFPATASLKIQQIYQNSPSSFSSQTQAHHKQEQPANSHISW